MAKRHLRRPSRRHSLRRTHNSRRRRTRRRAAAAAGRRTRRRAAGAAGRSEIQLAVHAEDRGRHARQAPRRPRQGQRPREVHVRRQASRDAVRARRPLAVPAREGRLDRFLGRAARARFQDVAHHSRSEGRQDERRDVPGRRGRGRRGGHRRTRHRRRARGEGGVRGAAVGDQRRVRAGRPRAGGVFPNGNVRAGEHGRKPAISRRDSRPRRTRSSRPTRRTSSRTSAWSRTARCASGTATS